MSAVPGSLPHVRPDSTRLGDTLYRIGATAKQIGVSASALRQWERQGLVRPIRSRSGYRLYSEIDLDRLRRIRRLRHERLNAPGILRVLSGTPPRRGDPATDGRLDAGRLRAFRLERGLSLRSAAGRARLSVSHLSALERNASSASVATLQRLTHAYGITMLDLFAPLRRRGRSVRRTQRAALELDASGVRIEQLARETVLLEPQLFVLAPRASSEGAYAHEGEEFLYILEGALTVWVGATERYRLGVGDALTFPSTLPHRWRNRARGETRLLWINTPPTF